MRESPRAPLFVHDSRVYLIQPDWSLVVLDVDSGNVLHRDTSFRDTGSKHYTEPFPYSNWQLVGKLALASGGRGLPMIDLEKNALVMNYEGIYGENMHSIHGKTVFLVAGKEIVALNCETLEAKKVCAFTGGNFALLDNRFLLVYSSDYKHTNQKLESYDAGTLALQWTKTPDPEQTWLGMACRDNRILVFTGVEDETKWAELHAATKTNDIKAITSAMASARRHKQAIDSVLMFDDEGTLVETYSPNPADFGGEWPTSLLYFTFQGVYFRDGQPAISFESEDKQFKADSDYATKRLGIKSVANNIRSSDGALAGILLADLSSGPGEKPRSAFGVYCIDGDNQWTGRIGTMAGAFPSGGFLPRSFSFLFQFAITEKYVLYAGPNGAVECLDRLTGRSRWIYLFPHFDMNSWNGRHSALLSKAHWERHAKTYYDIEYFSYRQSLIPSPNKGLFVQGDDSPPNPRVIVDPSPVPFPKIGITAITPLLVLCAGITLCLYLAFAAMRPNGRAFQFFEKNRKSLLCTPMRIALAFALMTYLIYCGFGRLSLFVNTALFVEAMFALILGWWVLRKLSGHDLYETTDSNNSV